MATKLQKPVTREIPLQAFSKGWRGVIVTLQGDSLVFRIKGLRGTYPIALDSVLKEAISPMIPVRGSL